MNIFLRISLQIYFGILEKNTKYSCLLNYVNLNEAFEDQCGFYRNKVAACVWFVSKQDCDTSQRLHSLEKVEEES